MGNPFMNLTSLFGPRTMIPDANMGTVPPSGGFTPQMPSGPTPQGAPSSSGGDPYGDLAEFIRRARIAGQSVMPLPPHNPFILFPNPNVVDPQTGEVTQRPGFTTSHPALAHLLEGGLAGAMNVPPPSGPEGVGGGISRALQGGLSPLLMQRQQALAERQMGMQQLQTGAGLMNQMGEAQQRAAQTALAQNQAALAAAEAHAWQTEGMNPQMAQQAQNEASLRLQKFQDDVMAGKADPASAPQYFAALQSTSPYIGRYITPEAVQNLTKMTPPAPKFDIQTGTGTWKGQTFSLDSPEAQNIPGASTALATHRLKQIPDRRWLNTTGATDEVLLKQGGTPTAAQWAAANKAEIDFNKSKAIQIKMGQEGVNSLAADPSYVQYATNQLLQPGGDKFLREVVGDDKPLMMKVRQSLAEKGMPLEQLSQSSRQLGETSKVMIPKMNEALAKLDDPAIKSKLGPTIGRWNDFLAGKVGAGDPDFAALRATINMLQSGTMKAHVGLRGSAPLQAKFEGLFNTDKMNAATLKASLGAVRDFLQGYANELDRPGLTGPGASSTSSAPETATHIVPGPDGKMHKTNATGTIDFGVVQ